MAKKPIPLEWDMETMPALFRSQPSPAAPFTSSSVSEPLAPEVNADEQADEQADDEADEEAGFDHGGFCWPTPPYASYPPAAPQTDPLPCEIVGLNDKTLS
ncbi:MAG: hypothetical protein ABIQ60_14005, partial [Burkholderiaceae bacterium]